MNKSHEKAVTRTSGADDHMKSKSPHPKIIKAAAVQISPVLYSREGTVEKVCQQIIALGRQGVQFATFPETVVPY
jgi:hypothetical protein